MNLSVWRLVLLLLVQQVILFPGYSQDPRRFQTEIDRFRADTINYAVQNHLVLFTGSSSIRMWDGLAGDFPGLTLLNRGFGGSHMSDLLYYADTVITPYRPEMIFIYEGDNDISSGIAPEEIIRTAGILVERIRQKLPESVICFISAKPSLARWELRDAYLALNAQLKEFAAGNRDVFYLDVWTRALDEHGTPRKDIFLADGLHLNRAGYDIWRELVGNFLDGQGMSRIHFGVCTAPANGQVLRDAGFNYVEGGVSRDLMPGKPDDEFALRMKELKTCPLPVIACNGFLPGTLRVTGPDAAPDTVLRYAGVAFRRAEAVGIRTIVFGSSGSRNIPEGFDRVKARQQFVSLLKIMGPEARKYGVTIAIENLQKSESNFVNTVGEALSIVREVNDPNILLLADIFHMMRENEGPEILVDAGSYLVHCHIAELKDRTAPGMAGDDFRPYFSALKKIGYRGGISIEGSWKNGDLPDAYRVMKDQWEKSE
jgi:sugar phosphate isomerase/epimerase/lysophospholipase L1-like esterase